MTSKPSRLKLLLWSQPAISQVGLSSEPKKGNRLIMINVSTVGRSTYDEAAF